jgi:hypothetical protein
MANILTYDGANTFLPPSPVVPMALLITAITTALPMVITVSGQIPGNVYIPGQLVYLSIPFDYGMYQANALTAQIIAVNGNEFSVNVNSTQFDPFVVPSGDVEQPALLTPAGSRNTYNFTTLPFHALNGLVGN